MNIKKIFISLFVLCFAIVCFIGCTHTTTQSAHGKVAVITKGSDSDFWSDLKSGAVTAATEYNLELTVEGPDNESDCEAQNKLIRNAISRKVDVIVLSAIDYNNTAPAVQEAVDNGIKVIMIDSNVNVKNTQSFIGTNNIQAGKRAGEAVEKLCKDKGKIYIGVVSSGENTENNNERQQGFADYIGTLENAEIVKTVYVSSDQDNATAEAKKLLTEHPEINAVIGFNEWATLGVGMAISELDLADNVCGVGFDSNIKCVGMLETGEIDTLIVQNPFAIGYLAVSNAATLMSGKSIEPSIETSVYVVDRSNMFNKDVQKVLFSFE